MVKMWWLFQCRNPIHRAHYELFTRACTRRT